MSMQVTHQVPPVVFLDMDDVLCISEEHTGVQVLLAFERNNLEAPELWAGLVNVDAIANLQRLHSEFSPNYVISSSWATYLDRTQMCEVFTRARLHFVLENLHTAWKTPRARSTSRRDEIEYWLDEFRADSQPFIILDDTASGWSLIQSPLWIDGHVVLCEPKRGFAADKLKEAQRLLRAQL